MIEETPSPLMGEGWGGGEKPQLIELLRFRNCGISNCYAGCEI